MRQVSFLTYENLLGLYPFRKREIQVKNKVIAQIDTAMHLKALRKTRL